MGFMPAIVEPLIADGYVTRESIKGCSEQQVSALMSAQGVDTLPARYVEFLRFGGKNPYWLSQDAEWDLGWLLEAKEVAREIVVDDYGSDFTPFERAFIFQTHQGYMFYYFTAEDLGQPDPTFWIFNGSRPIKNSETKFTDWIRKLAQSLPETVDLRKRLYGSWTIPELGPLPGDDQ
ncbi:SMI1/KNR4 family protein [Nocardia sp. No.11]|jgi:hypothetical protein|uniref:SMI1/KNR4 family protein n=1 Tax=Nocardia sp. No.11 TaxID=3128861 RepID=UPI00319D8C95